MLRAAVTRWLYRIIIESPPAHELMLQIYLASEAFHHRFPWFNQPELVADPALQRLMRQHFADEDNHAKYFTLAMELKGLRPAPPPVALDYLVQTAAAFWEAKLLVGDRLEDLAQDPGLFTKVRNLFVQLAFKDLSEKRAIGEFHAWRALAKGREPEVYAVLKRVVEDEDWHVHIFDEQVHRFLADPEHGPELAEVYAQLKRINRRMTHLSGSRFLRHGLAHGLFTSATPLELRLIAVLAWIQGLLGGRGPDATAERLAAMADAKAYAPRTSVA